MSDPNPQAEYLEEFVKKPQYTLSHSIKKPTEQYGNEDFFYSVRSDSIKEAVEDMRKLREAYPALTNKEKTGSKPIVHKPKPSNELDF